MSVQTTETNQLRPKSWQISYHERKLNYIKAKLNPVLYLYIHTNCNFPSHHLMRHRKYKTMPDKANLDDLLYSATNFNPTEDASASVCTVWTECY